jgi:hypothetical protein
MSISYSPDRRGFFASDVVYANPPTDLIEIDAEYHAELMAAQEQGATITPDSEGVPQAVFPVALTEAEVLAAWRATAEVSRFQAIAALYTAGKLDDAEAAVTAAGGLTVIAWQNAQVFRRTSPMMNALAPALGLDDEALDELFLAAALIEA